MALLSVIRRWHFREGMPIREIERRTGLSRNTIRKYLRAGGGAEVQGSRPAEQAGPVCREADGLAADRSWPSRKQRRTVKQMHADLVALGYRWSYNRVAAFARAGRPTASAMPRPAGAAPSCRWCSSQARRSSSTGARTGRSLPASAPSCRWRIPSCRTAGRSSCGPICSRPTRCCSMPDPGLPGAGRCAAARHLRQHEDRGRQGSAAARRGRSTRASRPWPATTCSSPSSATRPRAGRRVRSRRTSRMRVAGCGSRCPASRISMRSMPGSRHAASRNGPDPAWRLPGTIADVMPRRLPA
jgi:hypothetical protein